MKLLNVALMGSLLSIGSVHADASDNDQQMRSAARWDLSKIFKRIDQYEELNLQDYPDLQKTRGHFGRAYDRELQKFSKLVKVYNQEVENEDEGRGGWIRWASNGAGGATKYFSEARHVAESIERLKNVLEGNLHPDDTKAMLFLSGLGIFSLGWLIGQAMR